jgi:tetratricopeptide (TPR) repeat protein
MLPAIAGLGRVFRDQGNSTELESLARQALSIAQPIKQEYANGYVLGVLAKSLMNLPDPSTRNPALAIELAQKAVQLCPADGQAWVSLGISHYRAGHFEQAGSALGRAIQVTGNFNSLHFFFFAMLEQRAGHPEIARRWYEQGLDWMKGNQVNVGMRRSANEAADLLGLPRPATQPASAPAN